MFIEVNFSYQRTKDFSLVAQIHCQRGCILGIEGPMGAGKSTLFHCLSGLLQPQKGSFSMDNQTYMASKVPTNYTKQIHIKPHKRRIAYLFQENRIFPHMNVASNLLYAHRATKENFSHAKKPANYDEILELLQLASLLKKKTHHLSGGEKRRISLGRTLLSSFDLLLLDEPFLSLSETQANDVIDYIKTSLNNQIVFFASHHSLFFTQLATEITKMNDGRIQYHCDAIT